MNFGAVYAGDLDELGIDDVDKCIRVLQGHLNDVG